MVDKAITSQHYLADKLAVMLVLKYALRRAELAGVQLRHFDFEARTVTVQGKGGKFRTVPIVHESFWREIAAFELENGGRSQCLDFFLVCPWRKVGMKEFHYHQKGVTPRQVHRWWYRRLQEAGVTDEAHGLGMHRGRHTVATKMLRKTGNIVAAQKQLGHSRTETTESFYASFNTTDLAAASRLTYEDEDLD